VASDKKHELTRDFFSTLPSNILRSFCGRNVLWHLVAIGATLFMVSSGLDWTYFTVTRPLAPYLFPAVILGWRAPILFPVALYIVGVVRKDLRAICTAYSTAQAAVIGVLISSAYKAFTGRPGLRRSALTLVDTSREFHFGFLKGGVFFGWPSSHATVACAMSAALWTLYPRSKTVRCVALPYALYIGVGVSMTIHWFSDFVAGAIIGTAIGTTVGNVFKKSLAHGS
jgi:membrane-associated phospholipid phosphatase